MRSSSAGALADMRDTWEALLREHEGEELALAQRGSSRRPIPWPLTAVSRAR